jgi:hypothetical protein
VRKRIKHRERCKIVKSVTPSGVTDFTILHLSWCWTLYVQHEQIMSPLRRRQTYCFFLLWFIVMFSYNFVPVVTFFIFWYRFMIFSMKVSDHPPVCDILSRPSSGLVHQGQILFDFWGHFCVRDIAFFIIPHRFMILGMRMNYHQAVCLVSACPTLDLDLWFQGQDNRCDLRSQLPHLIIFKQCILFPRDYGRNII